MIAGGAGRVRRPAGRGATTCALWFFSDRTDVWSLYRKRPHEEPELVVDVGGDIAGPQWVFGQSRFALLADGRVAFAYGRDGADRLAVLRGRRQHPRARPALRRLPLPHRAGRRAWSASPAGPASEPVVLRVDVDGGEPEILRPARDLGLDPAWFSRPEHVTFPTERRRAPASPRRTRWSTRRPTRTSRAPDGELPPLHGDGARRADRRRRARSSTSTCSTGPRAGFCVADVDYRGSTGYGRRYRDALQGRWGVARPRRRRRLRPLPGRRRPGRPGPHGDPRRLAPAGTPTLAALTMRPGVFTAGASHYGVADLGALAAETHKFESRYLDGLVAPWPAGATVYAERSPINHVDALDTPLAVFQGDEDRVVPPDQAEAIVAALRAKGVPHAYLLFAGEQHGFRKAENIRAALDGELSFYAQVWGFDLPADEGIEPDRGAASRARLTGLSGSPQRARRQTSRTVGMIIGRRR